MLEIARGGEGPEGARGTVFIIGRDRPAGLRRRVERRHDLVRQVDPVMDGVSGALSFVARLSM